VLFRSGLGEAQRAELKALVAAERIDEETVARVRRLYQDANVFDKATRLVDKYQERAEAVADEVQGEELRRLLYYLVDTVLERPQVDSPQVVVTTLDLVAKSM
jgi:geranylgeranyl diphosphate synthase, type II